MIRILPALLVALQTAFALAAQQPVTARPSKTTVRKAAVADDIFSGTVTATSPDAVSIVRKLPARADESRQFVIDRDTKVEGKLKLGARVTVRFKANGDGAVHALRIIVRADAKSTGVVGRGQRTGPVR